MFPLIYKENVIFQFYFTIYSDLWLPPDKQICTPKIKNNGPTSGNWSTLGEAKCNLSSCFWKWTLSPLIVLLYITWLACMLLWAAHKHWATAPSTQSFTIQSSVVHVVNYRLLLPLTVVCGWPAGLRRWCCHAKSEWKTWVTSHPLALREVTEKTS